MYIRGGICVYIYIYIYIYIYRLQWADYIITIFFVVEYHWARVLFAGQELKHVCLCCCNNDGGLPACVRRFAPFCLNGAADDGCCGPKVADEDSWGEEGSTRSWAATSRLHRLPIALAGGFLHSFLHLNCQPRGTGRGGGPDCAKKVYPAPFTRPMI